MPSLVATPVQRNRFQRGDSTTSIVAAAAKPKSRFSEKIYYVTQRSTEKSPPSQEVYGNDFKMQSATHCRVCLARNHRLEMGLYTLRSKEIAQIRKAS